ncbi:hypothetical protein CIK63_09460 [Brevibacterium aurantiacum]|nr:hypothetical protein CIK63_09460 [Brevibacterium aurantiacum]
MLSDQSLSEDPPVGMRLYGECWTCWVCETWIALGLTTRLLRQYCERKFPKGYWHRPPILLFQIFSVCYQFTTILSKVIMSLTL